MENNIPEKTLLKIFDLIQSTGVNEYKALGVHKFFSSGKVYEWLKKYMERGKVEDLNLYKLKVKKLPEGLEVKRLFLTGNKTLKHLPKIKAEKIWAANTNIQTIEEGLKCTILNLGGNKVLKHLPKVEAEEIWAIRTNIESISDGLKCKELDLIGNQTLKNFPRNLKVDILNLEDTYFSQNSTEEKVRKLIEAKGGTVGEILI